MATNWKNNEKRKEKISKTLREKAKKKILPWQIKAIEKREKNLNEYNSFSKICKHCGKIYYKGWTKSGKSDFCSCKCARSFSTSKERENINKKVSKTLKGISTTKGGKVNVLENYLKNPKHCLICGKVLSYEQRKRKTCSEKCKRELIAMTTREKGYYDFMGGYREGSEKSKKGYYKGFYCASTYELAYYIFCIDNGIKIERNKKSFSYTYQGINKKYFPDFKLENELIEIKGFHSDLTDAKVASVDEPIRVLYLEDLEDDMKYVDDTYGVYHKGASNNYYTLYDKVNPNHDYVCSHCGEKFINDKKLKTKYVFCSDECRKRFENSKPISYFSKEWINENTHHFEDFSNIRIDKEKNLYSNKRRFVDGSYEKLKYTIVENKKQYYLYNDMGERVKIRL